ncbi:hypothetical protein [Thermobifida cellulosilytica]|jgi:hypothetical protein|uniref:Uncharacterized protein n=1 Tax=Thermobifida cellulosilytica TB100 TaxID=665004 RepID=A0A147KDM4_THECS|nr:hypothetical protein [Thermobifida cellulosilytica]KUP95402.1 hypothetical protein AC529_17705 [Thermobifida cellulosilytica TB100]
MARPSIDFGEHTAAIAALVRARREQLGCGQAEFAQQTPKIPPRLLQDLESGRRSRYSRDLCAKLEFKLGWTRGSIERMAAGGVPSEVNDLISVVRDESQGTETRRYLLGNEELLQRIYIDLQADTADMPEEEARALVEQALETARVQALLVVHEARRRRMSGNGAVR